MKYLVLLSFWSLTLISYGQNFSSYMTGDPADVTTETQPGIVLMGGAGEHDEAMKWFLERAGGGDIVVIRASGSDGYNDYLYSQLGVTVNSVETIVFHNADAAYEFDVLTSIQNAEAIWIAGGDQWDYVDYWQGNTVEDLLNDHMLEKQAPIGGISAGMAVLGGAYFSAQNGTVSSASALANPYINQMAIGYQDFLQAPHLSDVVTDTHYDDPDRRGRHVSFMARMVTDHNANARGIACDEYAAVCIDGEGKAWCFGEAPQYEDYVYFLRMNCVEPTGPEVCTAGQPLTWNRGMEAIKAYKVNGTPNGSSYFDLNDWLTGQGGNWEDWYVESGELFIDPNGTAPECAITSVDLLAGSEEWKVYPNPSDGILIIEGASENPMEVEVWSPVSGFIRSIPVVGKTAIHLDELPAGMYLLKSGNGVIRWVKQ